MSLTLKTKYEMRCHRLKEWMKLEEVEELSCKANFKCKFKSLLLHRYFFKHKYVLVLCLDLRIQKEGTQNRDTTHIT